MTDWERIVASADNESTNPCVKFSPGNCPFAVCALSWRSGLALEEKEAALLEWRYMELAAIVQKWAYTSCELGAVYDWALKNRNYETWLRGRQL